jgi:arginyl-tRNA synthetase
MPARRRPRPTRRARSPQRSGISSSAPERRAPHALPFYAIRLADDFHRFYHEHRVLESEQEAFRLALCEATRTVIARSLDLVGVDSPERM